MQRVAANGAEFEYETVGEGEPLFLIHGSITAETWHCLLARPELTSRYRVTHFYRRGFMGSTKHDGPFSLKQQAEDAAAVMKQVVGGRAHVAGHSYGAATLLQLAVDEPELVGTVALLEPPLPVPGVEAFMARLTESIPKYEGGDPRAAVLAFMDVALGPGPYQETAAPNMPEGWLDRAVADASTMFEVEFQALPEWEFGPAEAAKITQPVLSVLGAISDPFFVEGDELIHHWLPQAETFVVPDASHGLQFMNPGAVAQGLMAFMAKHPIAG